MAPNNRFLIIYAPNLNSLGGTTLLEELIIKYHGDQTVHYILDQRQKDRLQGVLHKSVRWAKPSIFSRLLSEFHLYIFSKRHQCTILMMSNLPPLLPVSGSVTIFFQNRLLVSYASILNLHPLKKLKFKLLGTYIKLFARSSYKFIVQTGSTRHALTEVLGKKREIAVIPWMPQDKAFVQRSTIKKKTLDFIFISTGETHKNHRQLFAAWELLALEGIRPTLTVTIDQVAWPELCRLINEKKSEGSVKIRNIGQVARNQLLQIMQQHEALIFPSQIESLGLPLLEAREFGIDILAPENDYVRDVCCPVETFDNRSAHSIAHAVKRYLKINTDPRAPASVDEFMGKVLK